MKINLPNSNKIKYSIQELMNSEHQGFVDPYDELYVITKKGIFQLPLGAKVINTSIYVAYFCDIEINVKPEEN